MRPKLFDIVMIDFWDHCVHSGDGVKEVPCTIFGLLIRENKSSYHIMNWGACRNWRNENTRIDVVLKKTVVRYTVIDDVSWPPTYPRLS